MKYIKDTMKTKSRWLIYLIFLNISYNHAQIMFKYLDFPIRNVLESKNQKKCKEKI